MQTITSFFTRGVGYDIILLVFPFESQMSNVELTDILKERLHVVKPFELKSGGISKKVETFGNYLFLNVMQGTKEIEFIHQALYDNEFKEFDIGLPYIPHMTIRNLSSVELLNNAFNNIKSLKDTFSTVVKKISVEMIGYNEESIIVIEKELV